MTFTIGAGRRRSGSLFAAAGLAAAVAAAAEAPRIEVGANVLVSRDDAAHPHEEVQVGTHPTDPKKLVACSMVDVHALSQRKMHTAVYASADGGKTWALGPTIPESGDPVCDFGPDGAAYFGAIGDSPSFDPAIDWHFKLHRSADGGKDWKLLSDILTGDRPWLAFDASSGPNRGWLYLTYQSRAGVLDSREKGPTVSLDLTHSTDLGKTWSLPRAYGVITGQRLLHSLPTMMATLSDGTVVISNWQNLKRRAVADEDGAAAPYPGLTGPATCEVAVVLVDPDGWKRPTIRRAAEKYCGESPTVRTVDALAVDVRSEAFRDRIYVAWTDERSGRARILFTASGDRGLTWSKPRAVDDPPPGLAHAPDSFMPTLAVNKDGVVGLTWYDRRENPDNIGYVARFTASLDGGESWLPSVRVSEQAAQFRQGAAGADVGGYVEEAGEAPGPLTLHVFGSPVPSAGDTAGLRADADGIFHAVWIDNRSGPGEVYTAPVKVLGPVSRHGSPELAALADVSARVAVDLADVVYDPKAQRIAVEASVRNKSDETLRGRLVVRVLSVDSGTGRAALVNAENGASGAGATFDFTGSVPEGGLQPKQSTRPKTLRFQLKDVRLPPLDPKEPWKALRPDFLGVDLQVLAEAPPKAEKPEEKEKP